MIGDHFEGKLDLAPVVLFIVALVPLVWAVARAL